MAAPDVGHSPWAANRLRAEALRERYPFAAEVLGLYLALLDVWQGAWDAASRRSPRPADLAAWSATHVLPGVVAAAEASGPEVLGKAARDLIDAGGLEQTLGAWLAGADLPPVERFLARASLAAPLRALGEDAGAACAADPSPRGDRRCPRCGGPPQLSYRSADEDRLVSGRRYLECSRCGHSWSYSASACPSCGETTGSQHTIYAEQRAGPTVARAEPAPETGDAALFGHLRVDACATCQRYVIDVDLGRDTRAVPEVDELAALPLGLYATDQGLSKITPNLMGL